ncbi:hypothetical protein BDY17DRAFT_22388 [Neohortaea acidophila]|uniref:Secreted protein n=1 Tax=Neohortaea acidophila TaxID=245834 RepID=A0A6A6Q6C2_9PEZI|nr:uncharacterized protein BDY17DRAFT_22388 [Neohortaea acidophila]KAF2487988.1 hypothetical protein BDY17DRAFT_22388 [Neohortaea acidophila]
MIKILACLIAAPTMPLSCVRQASCISRTPEAMMMRVAGDTCKLLGAMDVDMGGSSWTPMPCLIVRPAAPH